MTANKPLTQRGYMNPEELLLLLDELQCHLPKCANQVLLRLVAKCLRSNSNRVDISANELARELRISKDAVKVARRALAHIVGAESGKGESTSWTLPTEWFAVQMSLYGPGTVLVTRTPRPGNQDTSVLETRTHRPGNQDTPAWLPGHTGLVTRTPWESYQDTTGLETRTLAPEINNLRAEGVLETRTVSIDRSRIQSSVDEVVSLRDSIEGVSRVPPEFSADSEQLKRWLRFFMSHALPSTAIPDGPDEVILAKCLAIGTLQQLNHVLISLQDKHTRPGKTWAWFVTVFCQRIHRTKETAAVRAPELFTHRKKAPSYESADPGFASQLVSRAASGMRSF